MTTHLLGALVSALLATAPAQDPSWTAWYGCWRAEAAAAGEFLCITPDEGGVRMSTIQNGTIRAETRVITDGRARRVETETCEGSELAHWSADGRRVFLTSELSCDSSPARKVSGIFAITGPSEWLSVQTVTIEGRVSTRTVRYRAVDASALPDALASAVRTYRAAAADARTRLTGNVNADDVTEAVRAVDAPTVQEWLSATGQDFQLEDDDSPTTSGATYYTSALDYLGSANSGGQYSNRDYDYAPRERTTVVHHVVDRPVYVSRHVHWVDSCWSPWGYDSWGWRSWYRPGLSIRIGPVVIRRGPIIIGRVHRGPTIIRISDRDRYWQERYRERDRYYDRDRYTDRDRDRRDNGGRVTRDGYRNGEQRMQPPRESGIRLGLPTYPSDRRTEPTRSAPTTRSAQPRESRATPLAPSTRSSTPRAPSVRSSSSSRERSAPSRSSESSRSSSSGRTAKARTR